MDAQAQSRLACRWRDIDEKVTVMSPKAVLVLLGVFGVAILARAGAPVPEPVLPESFEWFGPPGHPGLEAAWVVGAEQESGLYALRVRLAAGARIAPHTHPDSRYSTVLSGTLYVGFGETVDESAMVAVPAGGVYVAAANQPHYLWARDGEVEYQESGVGPTGTVAVGGR
jgi:quercetin dioxygenase-like cupin family protein